MTRQRPIKVAVIGGGCAATAAAFELTRPEHEGRYEVTVYQLGWRLGGKGASGRGVAGRIEEHGLHVWMGWYENAFRLMRECYAELGRDPRRCPIADWRDAFTPSPLLAVIDRSEEGGWLPWVAALPPTEGLPGDPESHGRRWSVQDYMVRGVLLLRTLLETAIAPARERSADHVERSDPDSIRESLARLGRYGQLATVAGLIQGTILLEGALGAVPVLPQKEILGFLDALARNARGLLDAQLAKDPTLRRVWQVIDLTLATLRGAVRSGLATDPRGFDAIDEYDCREWLLLNGASQSSLDSGYLRALYDLGFSYEEGDVTRPRISAGQALRGMVRTFFTYRGAVFWKMHAGMGDVVFAPLYEVLHRRGVRFEFFHRLENVRLADGASFVEALELDVQAEPATPGEYQPLVDVRGLPCWPSAPDFRQLADGDRLRDEGRDFESHWDRRKVRSRTLRVGRDFDLVVLGVGLGAIPHACKDIVARDARWRAMVQHVKTVPTQAFQIWLGEDMSRLGWNGEPVTLSGFCSPFDTWADMRHLLPREDWPSAPRSLAYFCSVLPDGDAGADRADSQYPRRRRDEVRQNAIRFLGRDVRHLWPSAANAAGSFRWDLLVDPVGNGASSGEERFTAQFWSANVNPSDRYVLSLPGSSAYRISPLDPTYDNLTVAGDWTDCGFNAGCVEAAVISGRLAAHAISRSPALADVVGYDHP